MTNNLIVMRIGMAIALAVVLGGCGGYPRLLNFPFDRSGRNFNSAASEVAPDIASRYIVFVSDRNRSQDIYVFDAENRRLIEVPGLNSLDAIAADPAISEDGRYIVYTHTRRGRSNIHLYDRETEIDRNLTSNLQAEVRHPTISAQGDRIAYEVAIDGQWDIRVCDLNGNPIDLPGM
jgi:Tol biopolymer transport system component